MPMLARSLSGSFGFSVNFTMEPSSPSVMMPKRLASAMGTWITAMVQSALFFLWTASMSE